MLDSIRLTMPGGFDILVVDDGSSDNTREVCEKRGAMVISHIYNLGYGAALKTSYKYAVLNGYDYIVQLDADGQHDISNIKLIHKALQNQESRSPDIVIGSRFLPESKSFHVPFFKRFVIYIFRSIIKAATNNTITDPTSGLHGLNRSAFSFYARFDRFSIDYPDANMIIQMLMNDFIVEEIPAVMHPRLTGASMHSGIYKPIKYVIKMLLSVFIVCVRESLNRKNKGMHDK